MVPSCYTLDCGTSGQGFGCVGWCGSVDDVVVAQVTEGEVVRSQTGPQAERSIDSCAHDCREKSKAQTEL